MGAPQPDPVAHCQPAAGPRGRVLLVDDEQAMLVLLERVLRADNDVTMVGSGPEALALLGRGERFDVVLCDMMMPAMSGIELHDALVRGFPEMAPRLVFCTAGADAPHFRALIDTTGNRYISKPFKMAQVRSLVREFVTRSP